MDISTIILSRTDGIGDVILTLPMAGIIKRHFPECKIIFLGKSYTRDIVALSEHVDRFISLEEIQNMKEHEQINFFWEIGADAIIHVFPRKEIAVLARKAKIPLRIGTSHRIYHWFNCNKKIHFSRLKSSLHEAQLNVALLKGVNIDIFFEPADLIEFYGFSKIPILTQEFQKLIHHDKFNLVIHPKSKGSAREWGLENYRKLIEKLPEDKFQIFITGTEDEGKEIFKELEIKNENVIDLCGKLSLMQLIAFTSQTNGLLACSTGPLHIAAALDKFALGIYAPMRPIFPTRWAPLGKNATYLVKDVECNKCNKSKNCECISAISPDIVMEKLMLFYKKFNS